MNEQAHEDISPAHLQPVMTTGHLIEGRLDNALRSHGLTLAKLGVLRELALANEPLTLGQLAERISCVKSNITQLVDRMEKSGLVKRVPDTIDRRCMRAALTDEGRRRYKLGVAEELQIEQEILENLTEQEQEQLARLLGRLVK